MRALNVLGILVWIVSGVWGFILTVKILNAVGGLLLVVIGVCVLPCSFAIAPWYAGAVWGEWLPLLVIYCGGLGGMACVYFGAFRDGAVWDE